MATTTPDNIYYPSGSDKVGPLRAVLEALASSVQAAIAALRAEAVPAELPMPNSVVGANVQAVSETAWADLPNIGAVTITLPKAAWVTIDVGSWVVATAGDTRISARVTGATAIGETQIEASGSTASWGQVIYAGSASGTRQQTSHRTVRLNAGTNTIRVRAYRTGGGVHQANYTTLQVSALRWA